MFPSPIGELHFSIICDTLYLVFTKCFRPLSGSYISQHIEQNAQVHQFAVSVPYRGATFLNVIMNHLANTEPDMFPSPIGELHFSTTAIVNNTKHDDDGFRPLSGSYISQLPLLLETVEIMTGFRPLSGSYISQRSSSILAHKSLIVSVPYRGATFLNVFIMNEKKKYCSFRPLSGSYISQPNGMDSSSNFPAVSVPYRGATFLNNKGRHVGKQFCFRPLSGSYISQQVIQ